MLKILVGSLHFQCGLFGKGSLIPSKGTTFSPVMEGALDHYHFMLGPADYLFEVTFSDLNLSGRYGTLRISNDESSVTFKRDHRWDNYERETRKTSAADGSSPAVLLIAITLLIKTAKQIIEK